VTRRGLVTVRHRREARIETSEGVSLDALIGGRHLKPLTGDEVSWHQQSDGTIVVDEILPRQSVLERIDSRGRSEGVAANVSLLAVVVSPRPEPDWQLADRYLVAAEMQGIDAVIVRNKQDIEDVGLDTRANAYAALGYTVVSTCARDARGIDRLASVLSGKRSVLLGQSGVGKSSLLNALLENDVQAIGHLSERKSLGRHTTTSSVLYRLPGGGEIIDSPGVRRYAPYIAEPAHLDAGFVEFRAFRGQCRFHNCRHADEPDCAVRNAVAEGKIQEARYRSFIALRSTLEGLP